MAREVRIPITDADSNCSNGYLVRYKPAAAMNWITLDGLQQVNVDTISLSPLVVEYYLSASGLSDSTPYTFEITRQCCDGTFAAPTIASFTTGS